MENHLHSDANLFAQLGLASSEADIKAFIKAHRPLDPQIKLADAPFWSPAQAKFLHQQMACDADWAAVVDKLNASLR